MIDVARSGARTTITLNRPDKANALTEGMLAGLCEAVETAREQKVIVLTGAGRVFSAGADLEAAKAGLATSPLWERLSGGLAAHPGLTVCALNGTVAGGAMGMALACDIRLAVPAAKAFYPVMALGFLPQPSDPKRLAALVRPGRAKLMLMGGVKVGSDEALAWGLFDRVVEDLDAAVDGMVSDALSAAETHVRGIKALF